MKGVENALELEFAGLKALDFDVELLAEGAEFGDGEGGDGDGVLDLAAALTTLGDTHGSSLAPFETGVYGVVLNFALIERI